VTERQPSFLGSVLKAVVSTPNAGNDDAAYQREVVEPARQWRRLWDERAELSAEEQQAVIAQLKRIFAVKGVDADEQRDRLQEIADLHGIAL
jgi:hypothetical protein